MADGIDKMYLDAMNLLVDEREKNAELIEHHKQHHQSNDLHAYDANVRAALEQAQAALKEMKASADKDHMRMMQEGVTDFESDALKLLDTALAALAAIEAARGG